MALQSLNSTSPMLPIVLNSQMFTLDVSPWPCDRVCGGPGQLKTTSSRSARPPVVRQQILQFTLMVWLSTHVTLREYVFKQIARFQNNATFEDIWANTVPHLTLL